MNNSAKPFLLGLTGSIGMGKSTAAAMFARRGVPVWSADDAVHAAYARGGAAVAPVTALCAQANRDGEIDRAVLRNWIAKTPDALARLVAVVHPLVAQDRDQFTKTAIGEILLFDIPLLFENGTETSLDAVAVVSTDAATQRARVLARPDTDAETFEALLAKQLPDAQKRARADYVIPTDALETAELAVDAVLVDIRAKLNA